MADNIPERKQQERVGIAILIGITTCTVIGSALLFTIFGEPVPTAAATAVRLTESMIHSPDSTLADAIAQAAPTFFLVTFYVGIATMWLGFFDQMHKLCN